MKTVTVDLPSGEAITGAFFSTKKVHHNDPVRGVIVPIQELPKWVEKFNAFPDRFTLEGWEEVIVEGAARPDKHIILPESHTIWVSHVSLNTDVERPLNLWAFGAGFLGKDRRVVARMVADGQPWTGQAEERWLAMIVPEKVERAIKQAEIDEKNGVYKRSVRQPTAPRAPRALTASGEGGGSSGTAVTKMTPEERAEYKARLLAKPVLTDRDRRHLSRIENLGG